MLHQETILLNANFFKRVLRKVYPIIRLISLSHFWILCAFGFCLFFSFVLATQNTDAQIENSGGGDLLEGWRERLQTYTSGSSKHISRLDVGAPRRGACGFAPPWTVWVCSSIAQAEQRWIPGELGKSKHRRRHEDAIVRRGPRMEGNVCASRHSEDVVSSADSSRLRVRRAMAVCEICVTGRTRGALHWRQETSRDSSWWLRDFVGEGAHARSTRALHRPPLVSTYDGRDRGRASAKSCGGSGAIYPDPCHWKLTNGVWPVSSRLDPSADSVSWGRNCFSVFYTLY